MLKKLKNVTFGLIAGANVVTIIVMLLLGFADHLHPAEHPTLSSLGILFPFAALANLVFLFFWLIAKWRWALIPFIGFMAAYAPMRVYIPFNVPSSPPDDAIKVISYNSAGFVYNINCDNPFEQLTEYLRQSKADIVCIQEDNNGKQKMADFYNSLYPYNDTVKVNESKKVPNNLGIHTVQCGIKPCQCAFGIIEMRIRIIERTPVMCADNEKTQDFRIIILQDITDGEEIAQRLGHLHIVHADKTIMHPVIDKRLPGSPFRLGNLILMMRELQVESTAMDIEMFPQQPAGHR